MYSRESSGQPGLKVGPFSSYPSDGGIKQCLRMGSFQPLVLACLTVMGFETQGLDLQEPTLLARLELEDRAGCSTGSHFSDLEVQKGHSL